MQVCFAEVCRDVGVFAACKCKIKLSLRCALSLSLSLARLLPLSRTVQYYIVTVQLTLMQLEDSNMTLLGKNKHTRYHFSPPLFILNH